MPPAARITDNHVCPKVEPGPKPHVGGPVNSGERTVIIGFERAARVTDKLICIGPKDTIKRGEPTVVIGDEDAARLGDPTVHGGKIVQGCPTVIIGSNNQTEALRTDKPFCEECEKKRREREQAGAA